MNQLINITDLSDGRRIYIIDKIDFLKALHRFCDFLGDHTILSGTYDK